jgi:hypothetical protein
MLPGGSGRTMTTEGWTPYETCTIAGVMDPKDPARLRVFAMLQTQNHHGIAVTQLVPVDELEARES